MLDQDLEPEIKVDLYGTIYVTAIHGVPGGVDLWKSADNGATFAYLGEPDGAQDKCGVTGTVPCTAGLGGGDDSIDLSSGGHLFISSLYAGNVTMSTSYDGGIGGALAGQKWEVNPGAAGVPSDDRQWVAAYGVRTLGMTYNATALTNPPGGIGLFFVKSTDDGKTFGAPVEITAVTATDSTNVEGNLVADPYTGNFYTSYIPNGSNNVIRLASSTDGGATWNVTTAYTGPTGTTNRGVFPIMSMDRGGNLHMVFTKSDDTASHTNCHVFLISTANPAAATPTWTSAIQIDNSGTNTGTACLAWPVAGSPGVVDITWIGSSSTSPTTAPFDWHVYFAQVTSALSGSPTIASNQATGQNHNKAVCFNGLGCSSGTRDMAEYYTMTVGPDGNAYIAYEDSFNGTCGTEPNCTAMTWFTKQTAGPGVYTPPAGPPPATFAANINVGGGGRAEPNSWVDTHNCIFGGAINGASIAVFKSQDAGLTFSTAIPSCGTGTHGGDEDVKTVPKADGSRPDQIYTADLGITSVHICTSTNGGASYAAPGMNGAAGEVSVSSDRMWLWPDRGAPTASDQTMYLMDHEFSSEAIRFSALTNDVAWSPFASGITTPELILPPTSTLPNTNPGPVFVDKNSHTVFGVFSGSNTTTNTAAPPFGKMPDVWDAVGAASAAAGLPPGPFTNFPVTKGLIDSPAQAPSPAPVIPASVATFGQHDGNLFPSGAVDPAGNIYVVWTTNAGRYNTVQGNGQPSTTFDVWMASSHDGGKNFYGPFRVSNGVGTCMQPWIAAGDAGRVDISWYQSNSVAPPLVNATPSLTGGSNNMPPGSTWNVMFAQSLNANSREPVFTVSQASDHVIHTGSISNGGLVGSSDRSLLDFFQIAIGPDGLGNIMCADNASGSLHVNYMRQSGGSLALTNPSAVTCLPIPPLTGVVSRMTHGSITPPFDITLPLPPMSSPRAVEPRSSASLGSGNYTLVFTFLNNLTSVASATVTGHDPTSGTGTVSGAVVVGPNAGLGLTAKQCQVNLTNVSNQQYITVTLNSVADAAGNNGNVVSPQLGVLIGDVNGDGFVLSGDYTTVRKNSGNNVDGTTFRYDINADGFILSGDYTTVRKLSGTQLPSTP